MIIICLIEIIHPWIKQINHNNENINARKDIGNFNTIATYFSTFFNKNRTNIPNIGICHCYVHSKYHKISNSSYLLFCFGLFALIETKIIRQNKQKNISIVACAISRLVIFILVFALCASLNRNGEQFSCALSKLFFNGCQPFFRQIEGRMTGELEVHHSPQLRFLLCTHYLFTYILIGNRVQIGGINSYRYYL